MEETKYYEGHSFIELLDGSRLSFQHVIMLEAIAKDYVMGILHVPRDGLHIRQPIMIRTYDFSGNKIEHRATLSSEVYEAANASSQYRSRLSFALETQFRTLIKWGINPTDATTHIHYLKDEEMEDEEELTLHVYLPRRLNMDWMEFWRDLRVQTYAWIDREFIMVMVERYSDDAKPIL